MIEIWIFVLNNRNTMKKVSITFTLHSAKLLLYLSILFASSSIVFQVIENFQNNSISKNESVNQNNSVFYNQFSQQQNQKNISVGFAMLENEECDDESNDSDENNFQIFKFFTKIDKSNYIKFSPFFGVKERTIFQKPFVVNYNSLCILFQVFRI